jgi:hypothetical protein
MFRSKRRWSELTSAQRAGVLAMVAVQAVLAVFAQRDLGSRSQAEVRGPKIVWRVLTLNSAGAVAYLVVGRRSG